MQKISIQFKYFRVGNVSIAATAVTAIRCTLHVDAKNVKSVHISTKLIVFRIRPY
jgi:hypothetical protein